MSFAHVALSDRWPLATVLLRSHHTMLPALVLASLLAVLLAYRFPMRASLSLTAEPSPVEFVNAHPAEMSEWAGGYQRWTRENTVIVLKGVGQGVTSIRLRFFGGPAQGAGRLLTLRAGEYTLAAAPLQADWQELRVKLPPEAVDSWSGDLRLELATLPLQLPTDRRRIGVSLRDLELLDQRPDLLPPPARTLQLTAVVVLAFWCLQVIGIRQRAAFLGASALLLGLFCGLANLLPGVPAARLLAAQALALLLTVLPLTLLLALGLLAATRRWGWRRPPWWAVALRGAALLIFTLRLAGLQHPQFVTIDQQLRVSQLANIASGQAEAVLPRLEQQYEWGTREPVPYSLFTYYLLAPLTWLWGGAELRFAVEAATCLLDATIPLLLRVLLGDGPQRNAAAAWAGLCYAALPVGYLFFHDGSFPTTIGLWITLLALAVVRVAGDVWRGAPGGTARLPRSIRPELIAMLITLLALAIALGAYVTQIAFVAFLILALAASLHWLGCTPGRRRAAAYLALTLALALPLAWAIFYGRYTLPLIQRTIPAMLGLIASEGAVGRNSDLFFGTPINSVSEHLAAHFRTWPAVIAAIALAALLARWRERFMTSLGLAYAAFLATTLLAEQWFGLWNKHVYFAAPGVALLAGLGLAWLWRRGAAGKTLCITLLLFLFWESTTAWGNRVLWYILPPGAL